MILFLLLTGALGLPTSDECFSEPFKSVPMNLIRLSVDDIQAVLPNQPFKVRVFR